MCWAHVRDVRFGVSRAPVDAVRDLPLLLALTKCVLSDSFGMVMRRNLQVNHHCHSARENER